MIVPLFLLAVLVLLSARPSKKTLVQSYSSIPQTQAIKGIFVITIFFSHFCSYVHLEAWYDKPMQSYCIFLGQLMVAPFLFYSGYGIFESVKAKKSIYIKSFPKKRILKTLLHFDFAVILFLLLDLIIDQPVSTSKFLLSLTAWESIGNSNWFIFAILCAYTYTFLGLSIFRGKLKRAFIFISIMSLAFIAIMSHYKPPYWFDTILAFPLGCLLSTYKEKFDLLTNHKFTVIIATTFSVLIFGATKFNIITDEFYNNQLALLAFSTAIIFLSMHIRINNKILNWFGAQVFGIYILQRLPMNFLTFLHVNEYSIHLFFIISLASTLVLSVLFSKWTDFFDKVLLKTSKY